MYQPSEIKSIENLLTRLGVKNKELNQELLDHFISDVEHQINKGSSYQKAVENAKARLESLDLSLLNEQIDQLQTSNRRLFRLILIIATVLSISWFLYQLWVTREKAPKYPWPIQANESIITSDFGERIHPQTKQKVFHRGIDIKADHGTEILAPDQGKVLTTGYDSKNGQYLMIQQNDGFITKYCHLSSIFVTKNQPVRKNQLIGAVGNSGKSSGPHLHYEILKDNKPIDPKSVSVILP